MAALSKEATAELAATINELNERRNRFYRELGEFISLFAGIEIQLLDVVYHFGQLKWPIAKALVSPLRVDSAITHLRRILFVRRLRSKQAIELTNVLDHLNLINKLRNDMLHYGFTDLQQTEPDHFWVTNARNVYARRAMIRHRISQKDLANLNADLAEISLRLISLLPHLKQNWELRGYVRTLRAAHPIGRPPAWNYKFPSQAKSRRKNRGLPPKRGGRPKASDL